MLAEQKAFEMCKAQKRWSLVTIQPSVVQGPPPGMRSPLHCVVSNFCNVLRFHVLALLHDIHTSHINEGPSQWSLVSEMMSMCAHVTPRWSVL